MLKEKNLQAIPQQAEDCLLGGSLPKVTLISEVWL